MNSNSKSEFLTTLQSTLQPTEYNLGLEDIALACEDWRKRYQTSALAIVSPKTVGSLQEVVRLCDKHIVAITPQGGNTGLVGGAVPSQALPDTPHIVLRTNHLRQAISIDPANLTITADAGHTLQEIQQAAEEAGYLFPLSLASEGSCTVGGNLSTNAGGVAVLRYGNMRELCLGLEFVTPQGELCGDLRGLRKNNTGYDLRHLLIGAEGTLGIITRACLKIYPAPTAKVVVWMNVKSLNSAVALLKAIQSRLYSELSSYEWMNCESIDLVQQHFPVKAPGASDYPSADHVLAEFTSLGTQEALIEQIETVLGELIEAEEYNDFGLLNVFVAQSLSENHAYWSVRENISEAQAKEGLNVKHDIACAVSRLPEFHAKATQALAATGIETRPILFGHLGDGNLHYNLSGPKGNDNRSFLAEHQDKLNTIVHEAILAAGGTISAEHGIGQLKATLLKEVTSDAQYALFKQIKHAIDPKGLMNPGKLVT